MSQDSNTSANEDAHRGPRHVAIIMDGNGRWATQRGRPGIGCLKATVRPRHWSIPNSRPFALDS